MPRREAPRLCGDNNGLCSALCPRHNPCIVCMGCAFFEKTKGCAFLVKNRVVPFFEKNYHHLVMYDANTVDSRYNDTFGPVPASVTISKIDCSEIKIAENTNYSKYKLRLIIFRCI